MIRMRRGKTSAIQEAVAAGSVEGVTQALRNGESLRGAYPDGETLLTRAIRSPNAVQILKLLLAAGARPDRTNSIGQTPLMVASAHGRTAAIRALIDTGADINYINSKKETALTYAVVWKQGASVEALLRSGANANLPHAPAWSPIFYAAIEGNFAIARALLSGGARCARRDRHKRTPAQIAQEFDRIRMKVLLQSRSK